MVCGNLIAMYLGYILNTQPRMKHDINSCPGPGIGAGPGSCPGIGPGPCSGPCPSPTGSIRQYTVTSTTRAQLDRKKTSISYFSFFNFHFGILGKVLGHFSPK